MTIPLTREAALEAVAMAMSYRADGYPMDRTWDLAMQYRRCSSEVLAAAPPAIRAALGLDHAGPPEFVHPSNLPGYDDAIAEAATLRAERDALAKRVGELAGEYYDRVGDSAFLTDNEWMNLCAMRGYGCDLTGRSRPRTPPPEPVPRTMPLHQEDAQP